MSFSFIHISDHHLGDDGGFQVNGIPPASSLRAVLRNIAYHAASEADFLISTGDLVEEASQRAYRYARKVFGIHSVDATAPGPLHVSAEGLHRYPAYFLPGNHDDREFFYENLFPRSRSSSLMNVRFEHKGVQFICLDWGPQSKAIAHSETLEFLRHALKRAKPSVILMHHSIVRIGSRWLDSFIADDVDQFWALVRTGYVLGVLSGHVHHTYENLEQGVPVFGLGSTVFQFELEDDPVVSQAPPIFRMVSVKKDSLNSRLYQVPLSESG